MGVTEVSPDHSSFITRDVTLAAGRGVNNRPVSIGMETELMLTLGKDVKARHGVLL